MDQQLIADTTARVTTLNHAIIEEDWVVALELVRQLEWALNELQIQKEVNEP